MRKNKKENIAILVLLIISLWIGLTNTIQAFKNPTLTTTELFLRMPKSLILQFEEPVSK